MTKSNTKQKTLRIILASKSKARRDLLKELGLKIETFYTNVPEIRSLKGVTCRQLVKHNALKKAKAAEKRRKNSVIIGADTVVIAGGRIIGKPSSLADARKTLKKISGLPQDVYSAIAVIGPSGRVYTACDKTKVYMRKLNDGQIDRYFGAVSPLEKAGSFDIRGPGEVFIKRIEGSYSNVVGLPVTKLAVIFEKMGFPVL
jgi:septum formation protein